MTVLGERDQDRAFRVPVVSFRVEGRGSREVVENVDARSDFGIRWGHFYSKRLVEEVLGQGEEGVVRVSMVHYNTGMLLPVSFFLPGVRPRRDFLMCGVGWVVTVGLIGIES